MIIMNLYYLHNNLKNKINILYKNIFIILHLFSHLENSYLFFNNNF